MTDVGRVERFVSRSEVSRLASVAVYTLGVVLAVLADTAAVVVSVDVE